MDYTVINIETAANPDYKGPQLAKRGEEKPGLSPITGRIIAIGYMKNGIPQTISKEDERTLVGDAIELFHIANGGMNTLVTFNGKLFDLPFITMRAAIHGIKHNFAPWLERYSNHHLDVYELVNCWKYPAKGTLRHWAHAFGVTMQEGSGEEMQGWWDARDYPSICLHNQSTLKATDEIFRRIAYPLLGIQL